MEEMDLIQNWMTKVLDPNRLPWGCHTCTHYKWSPAYCHWYNYEIFYISVTTVNSVQLFSFYLWNDFVSPNLFVNCC